jgi:hypothetical protein
MTATSLLRRLKRAPLASSVAVPIAAAPSAADRAVKAPQNAATDAVRQRQSAQRRGRLAEWHIAPLPTHVHFHVPAAPPDPRLSFSAVISARESASTPILGNKADARAMRFVVGRVRSRVLRSAIVRRLGVGGLVGAPAIGLYFAARAARGEFARAIQEGAARHNEGDRRVPLAFAAAGLLDGGNAACQVVSLAKTVLAQTTLPSLHQNIIAWYAHALALPAYLPVSLAAAATVCAVYGEVAAARAEFALTAATTAGSAPRSTPHAAGHNVMAVMVVPTVSGAPLASAS